MRPVKLPGMQQLSKPRNWNDHIHGKCDPLPVFHMKETYISIWSLTFWERVQVLFGRQIVLNVMADSHPPVMLEVN